MDERQKSIVRQSSIKVAAELVKIAHKDVKMDINGIWELTAALGTKIENWVNRE